MNRRAVCFSLIILAAAVLFYFENRPAYKSYFSDDDLNNLGWPTWTGMSTYLTGLITPKFDEVNFRPVGFLYYRIMGPAFHLNFLPYVLVLQALHVLHVVLLFLIARRLGLSAVAALAGSLFYAFHAAIMQVYWVPMYVFDLLCATFCLITLLLYLRGHWILALLSFWLAYKSKELAVMLPLGLLAYEWLLGQRRWKRLIPFFVISLNFGVQALIYNSHASSDAVYALNLSPQLSWKTINFYSSAIFFVPLGGLALIVLPIFLRDRRLYFGLLLMGALLTPLILLTNRFAQAYWYVPLIGLAIAVAAIADRVPAWGIAAFFVVWLPVNYLMLRDTRREIFLQADEARWYIAGLRAYAPRMPGLRTVIFESTPPHMMAWGIKGAIHQVFGRDVAIAWNHDPDASEAMEKFPVGLFSYYPFTRTVKGRLRTSDQLASGIDFHHDSPHSQLGNGWYPDDGRPFRRVAPSAELSLYRPATVRAFEIRLAPGENTAPLNITVFEDGRSLGAQTWTDPHNLVLRWPLAGGAGDHRVTIQSTPMQHYAGDSRDYGITMELLGYLEK